MKRFWFLWLWLCVIGACAQQDGVDKVLFNGKIVTLDGDSSIVRAIAIDGDRIVSLGTDTPVVPYPPLWVLFHFITRDTISAGVMGEAQKITREEALRAMGPANAELSFEEGARQRNARGGKTSGSRRPLRRHPHMRARTYPRHGHRPDDGGRRNRLRAMKSACLDAGQSIHRGVGDVRIGGLHRRL